MIVLTFLRSKIGSIPSPLEWNVRALKADRLQALSVALLDFKTIQNLEDWLHTTGFFRKSFGEDCVSVCNG